ncbi:penicillin-binding protein 1C [candidate division KSB1 bacterium]|nr:penicillin-binding protein 1C [candidate division KSB1 bacterium]
MVLVHLKKRTWFFAGPVLLYCLWLLWPFGKFFPEKYSTLVFDRQDNLLRVFLSEDEQYRFPAQDVPLPQKYKTTLLAFEDKRFPCHLGVDPLALVNAMWINLTTGTRIRGGSTITMQVVRLAHPRSRTYITKIFECFYAVKLSLHFSKTQILQIYADHVPMGRNVVGLQAASWYYYGKPMAEITWAEAALFTILPNAPSSINLSSRREQLLNKRNVLLERLLKKGIIDSTTFTTSCREPLPGKQNRIPFRAPHFCRYAADNSQSAVIRTTLDLETQKQVEDILKNHHLILLNKGIRNCAVLIAETGTGQIRAWVGSQSFFDSTNSGQVDGTLAYRSTGSLLKPFLVAKALDRGPYTMATKIRDVPTYYGTFTPQNALKDYSGLVSLGQTLIKSLNVPSVRLLNEYGVEDFYDFLNQAGLKGLFRSARGYGLTLILGGAEASLWEMLRLYASLGNMGQERPLSIFPEKTVEKHERLYSQAAAWLVLQNLSRLARPGSEFYWHYFDNQVPVAWKTGTSYGQKDGWAIGVNKQWTIGVWVGNFDGEGNALLGGAASAAPILFSLFNALSRRNLPMWFEEPLQDMEKILCCEQSGFPAGPYCKNTILQSRPKCSYRYGVCPYHRKYIIDRKTSKSVCSLCWSGIDTVHVYCYIAPPDVKEILEKSGQSMDSIPMHSASCPTFQEENRLAIIYPVKNIKIMLPRDYSGEYEKIVLSAKHQQSNSTLFWFLNEKYLGETTGLHEMAVDLESGKYKLVVQDEEGFTKSVVFTIYRAED